MGVKNDEVGVKSDLNIGDLVVVQVLLVDFFADDEQTNKILFLDHDLHLVEDKLQLLASVH